MELHVRVVDELMPDLVGHDRHPSAFIVYLFLLRRSSEGKRALQRISLSDMAEATGLSKRSVQNAVEKLEKRDLVEVERGGPTEVSRYIVKALDQSSRM